MSYGLEVEWITPCAYQLSDERGPAAMVKVLEVYPDGYYCAMVQFPDTHIVMGMRITRTP